MDIQIDLSGFGAPVVQNHTSKNIRLLRRYLHVAADVDLEQEKCDKSQKVWLMAMWRILGVPFKHNHNISKMKLSSLSESLPKKHENRLSLARPPTLAERLWHKWSWCIHREDHSELVHGLSVPPQGGCETSLEGFMALTAALSMVHPGSKLAVRNRLQGPEAGQSYQRAQVIAQLSVQWKQMAEICPASFPHLFRLKNCIPTMPIFSPTSHSPFPCWNLHESPFAPHNSSLSPWIESQRTRARFRPSSSCWHIFLLLQKIMARFSPRPFSEISWAECLNTASWATHNTMSKAKQKHSEDI